MTLSSDDEAQWANNRPPRGTTVLTGTSNMADRVALVLRPADEQRNRDNAMNVQRRNTITVLYNHVNMVFINCAQYVLYRTVLAL